MRVLIKLELASGLTKTLVVLAVVCALAGCSSSHGTPTANEIYMAGGSTGIGPNGASPVPGLNAENLVAGVCLTWTEDGLGQGIPRRVPCSEPHLVEVVSDRIPFESGNQQWLGAAGTAQLIATNCSAPARDYLGYDLDPDGRFGVAAFIPGAGSWVAGNHYLWCYIAEKTANANLATFSGEVRGADQTYLLPTGTCVLTTKSAFPVPCSTPHNLEVTGSIKIASTDRTEATGHAWFSLVYPCRVLDLRYLGGTDPPGVLTASSSIPEASWEAGTRTIECNILRVDSAGRPLMWQSSQKAHT